MVEWRSGNQCFTWANTLNYKIAVLVNATLYIICIIWCHLSATLLYLSSILLGGGSGGAGLMGLRQGAGAGFGADVGGGDTGETGAWPDPLLWTAKSSGKTGRSF